MLLVPAKQQSESAVCVHVSPPLRGLLAPPRLPRSAQSTRLSPVYWHSSFPGAVLHVVVV